MIFAFLEDDRSVTVYEHLAELKWDELYEEAEDGRAQFFDGEGRRLDAMFSTPNQRWQTRIFTLLTLQSIVFGDFTLRPSEPDGQEAFREALRQARYLVRNPWFPSLDDLRRRFGVAP